MTDRTHAGKTVVVTGASSGFGAMASAALAQAGHNVFAGIRGTREHNAEAVRDLEARARNEGISLQAVEMDVTDDASVTAAVDEIVASAGRLDVVIHNAGHMVLGPLEAFTPKQLEELYDVNAISTQRVNRAVLPHLREQRDGLLLWIGSTSTRGGTPPYLGPYFAAKAGMEALATTLAVEVARFGIETTIIVPGSFTTGTNHFARAGHPADGAVAEAYEALYPNLMNDVGKELAALAPADADPEEVARQVVRVVELPKGRRPFRVHIDPADDGAEVVNAVADRVREQFYERIHLEDLLHPAG